MSHVNWVLVGVTAFWLTASIGCGAGRSEHDDSLQATPPTSIVSPASRVPGSDSSTPQEARATATAVGAALLDLGYRVVVSGPERASSDAEVTYTINYECVRDTGQCAPLSLEFNWPLQAASFVQSDPQGQVIPAPLGRLSLAFGESGKGRVEVVLKVAASFSGEYGVGVYTHGSGITYSEGSVTHAETYVTNDTTP